MTFAILIKYATLPAGSKTEESNENIDGVFLFLLQGPFNTFRPLEMVDNHDKQAANSTLPNEQWTQLKFSPDGKMISIATNGTSLHLIEAFQGLPIHKFTVSQSIITIGLLTEICLVLAGYRQRSTGAIAVLLQS
jgi:hypothetical protein